MKLGNLTIQPIVERIHPFEAPEAVMPEATEDANMCGDLIHFPVQSRHPEWTNQYDTDPAQGALTRRPTRQSFPDRQCESGHLVLTAHFPKSSMEYVERLGDAFDFRFIS